MCVCVCVYFRYCVYDGSCLKITNTLSPPSGIGVGVGGGGGGGGGAIQFPSHLHTLLHRQQISNRVRHSNLAVQRILERVGAYVR